MVTHLPHVCADVALQPRHGLDHKASLIKNPAFFSELILMCAMFYMKLCDCLHQQEKKGGIKHTDIQSGAVGRRTASLVAIIALVVTKLR